MAGGYTVAEITDLVTATLQSYKEDTWADLTSPNTLQKCVVVPRFLKEKKRQTSDPGKNITRHMNVGDSGTAEQTGLYDTLSPQASDGLREITAEWAMTRDHWSYDAKEKAFNSGKLAILNAIKARRQRTYSSLAQHLEEQGLLAPQSATDTDHILGLFYWIVPFTASDGNATTGGFIGTNPVYQDTNPITAGAGGISSTTVPEWANWAAHTTAWTKADVIALMNRASRQTFFLNPFAGQDKRDPADQRHIYLDGTAYEELTGIAEDWNDNVRGAKDLTFYEGQVTYHGRLLEWVPYFDTLTGNRIVGVDWSNIYPVFVDGWFIKEAPPAPVGPTQPDVHVCLIQMIWQMICEDRRSQWIISTHSKTNTAA